MSATVVYPLAWRHVLTGRLGNLLTADVRVMLCGSGYAPAAGDEFAAAAAGFETPGNGYPPGGLPVTGRQLTAGTDGTQVLTCDPVTAGAADLTARWAVVYVRDPGGYDSSPLLSRVDFGGDVSPGGDDFTVTFPDGLLRVGGA